MIDPTFDAHGYPTPETLERIRDWPIVTLQDAIDAMDFAGRAWHWPKFWVKAPIEDFWGDYEGALAYLRWMLEMCEAVPVGRCLVSR